MEELTKVLDQLAMDGPSLPAQSTIEVDGVPDMLMDAPPLDDGFEAQFGALFQRLGIHAVQAHAEAESATAEQLFDRLDAALRSADEQGDATQDDMLAGAPAAAGGCGAATASSSVGYSTDARCAEVTEARRAMAELDEFERKLGLPLAAFGALGAGGAPDPGGTDTTAAAADAATEMSAATAAPGHGPLQL